ncbi:MAG: 3-isopropylmalate dehydratase [Caulobacterales bacterium]|nr:3-isopropylmalate dehydratase [Caulobacterales bacterium]
MTEGGRAWVFGDRVDTDVLAPGWAMKLDPDALARHCLAAVRPDFPETVRPGDVVVGGADFGIGSSREQAAVSLKTLGVAAVLARSFARIFYRNAINIGLPAVAIAPEADIADGDRLSVDLRAGTVTNHTRGARIAVAPIPDHLAGMIEAGGLMAHLQQRFGREVGDA